MNQKKTYEYADGSSNLYRLTETELRYVAVVAEESSSGSYSGGGGENKIVAITLIQYNTLQSLFEKAIRNTRAHTQNRVMMSSIVSSIAANEKKQCILKPGSAEMKEIESALKDILEK